MGVLYAVHIPEPQRIEKWVVPKPQGISINATKSTNQDDKHRTQNISYDDRF